MYALPVASTAMLEPVSQPVDGLEPDLLPPRYEERSRRAPSGASFATKASARPAFVAWNGSAVGKNDEIVAPTTYALPVLSTAMPEPASSSSPKRYVEYTSVEPLAAIFVTKASVQVSMQWRGPA